MIKNIHFDLKNIKKEEELFDLMNKILIFPSYFGNNWSALSDVLSDLSFSSEISGVNFVFTNWTKFEDSDLDLSKTLLTTLAWLTDPKQRIDNYNFTFQVRLED